MINLKPNTDRSKPLQSLNNSMHLVCTTLVQNSLWRAVIQWVSIVMEEVWEIWEDLTNKKIGVSELSYNNLRIPSMMWMWPSLIPTLLPCRKTIIKWVRVPNPIHNSMLKMAECQTTSSLPFTQNWIWRTNWCLLSPLLHVTITVSFHLSPWNLWRNLTSLFSSSSSTIIPMTSFKWKLTTNCILLYSPSLHLFYYRVQRKWMYHTRSNVWYLPKEQSEESEQVMSKQSKVKKNHQ